MIPGHACHICGSDLTGRSCIAEPEGLRCKGRRSDCTRRAMNSRRTATTLEDLEWMAATGESLAGASSRIEMHPAAIEKMLRREGRLDILTPLLRRNPRDWNAGTNAGGGLRRLGQSAEARERENAARRAKRASRAEVAA